MTKVGIGYHAGDTNFNKPKHVPTIICPDCGDTVRKHSMKKRCAPCSSAFSENDKARRSREKTAARREAKIKLANKKSMFTTMSNDLALAISKSNEPATAGTFDASISNY